MTFKLTLVANKITPDESHEYLESTWLAKKRGKIFADSNSTFNTDKMIKRYILA